MRKLFLLLCAVMVAVSTWASQPMPTTTLTLQERLPAYSTEKGQIVNQQVSHKFSGIRSKEITGLQRSAMTTRSEQADASKYDGKYILTLCDDIFDEGTGANESFEVDVTVVDGILTISGQDIDPFEAAFDEATATATFTNQYVGASSSYAFSYLTLDLNTEGLFSSFTARFNDDASALVFPAGAAFLEGAWGWSSSFQKTAAIKAAQEFDTQSNYFLGWYDGRSFVSLTKGEMTFSSAGKATYYDGLMLVNEGIDKIYDWEIEVEKCNEIPGLYRVRPYAVTNPVGTALGKGVDEDTYILINAQDIDKVFTKGDFAPYGLKTICGANLENNFNATNYGTLNDGVIEFPDKSFAYENGTKWYLVDSEGQPNLCIVFEGATIKDYTIEAAVASQVSADNKWTVNLTKGADVASVKYMVLPIEVDYSTLTQYGLDFDTFGVEAKGNTITLDPAVDNLLEKEMTEWNYVTVFLASFNDKGMKKRQTRLDLVVNFADKEDGWATVGKTDFTDLFIAPMFGESYSKEVEVQAKTDNSPVYRLVLPYSDYPADVNLAGLTTSMVIDASDPTWVEIPGYFTGIDLGYGLTAVGSVAALGFDKNSLPEDAEVGAITMDNNIVSFAPKTAFIHLPYYNGPSEWSIIATGGMIPLPAISLSVTVKNEKGELVEGATVSIKEVDTANAKATEQVITTNAQGKATLEVPFVLGYFGEITLCVNNLENKIKLNGSANNVEVTLSDSAITSIEADQTTKVVYDLHGRRIANPTSGLNIINGNKIMIKK